MPTQEVKFTDADIECARKFAHDVVNETYDRLNQNMTTRVFRLFVGKLGEIAIVNYCQDLGIEPNTEGMFEIYAGIQNVDRFDFTLEDGRLIDVKTANQPFHTRIIVPSDQFQNQIKDIYVGVFVHVNEKRATIYGYVTREVLGKTKIQNRGEGPGYEYVLRNLKDINEIINDFK